VETTRIRVQGGLLFVRFSGFGCSFFVFRFVARSCCNSLHVSLLSSPESDVGANGRQLGSGITSLLRKLPTLPKESPSLLFSSSELTDVLDPSLQTAPLFSVSIVSKPTKISTLVERGFYWLFDLGNTLTFSASDKRLLHMRTLELLARMEKRVIGVQDR